MSDLTIRNSLQAGTWEKGTLRQDKGTRLMDKGTRGQGDKGTTGGRSWRRMQRCNSPQRPP